MPGLTNPEDAGFRSRPSSDDPGGAAQHLPTGRRGGTCHDTGSSHDAAGPGHGRERVAITAASCLHNGLVGSGGRCCPFLEFIAMKLVRSVVVFDAADLHAESAFWAGLLDGHVFTDEAFHSVIDGDGEWRVGVQLAPQHRPPDWPDGAPQQVHLDLHVEDPQQAHDRAMSLGARLLQVGDLGSEEGHQVYADPAGHPFCIGWGQPSREALDAFVKERLG